MTTRVKICGIVRLEDALHAAEAGADMLGFNFYERSPRYIPPLQAADIQHTLMHLGHRPEIVGVFVNASAGEVLEIMQAANLDYAQLSGDEDPKTFERLQHIAFKAIRPQTMAEARRLAARFANPRRQPALLLDAYHPSQYGGTGRPADPDIAESIAASFPILLAGGLTPSNVARAVESVRPWGVDVASGVESSPGVKDPEKISAFIRRAKAVRPE